MKNGWRWTGVRKVGKSSFDIKVDNIPCVLSNHVENLKVEQEKLCLCFCV